MRTRSKVKQQRSARRAGAAPRRALATAALAQRAEYIWTDGQEGMKGLLFNEMRSKTKVLQKPIPIGGDFPDWSFDGSSTEQAEGSNSDCILRPCFSCPDPIRGGDNVLVLCEVMDAMGEAHPTNSRAQLRQVLDSSVEKEDPWFGFEQVWHTLAQIYVCMRASQPHTSHHSSLARVMYGCMDV